MNDEIFYRSIPLVQKETKGISDETSHLQLTRARPDADYLTGYMVGTIRNLQPLHVGTGQSVPPETLELQDAAPLVKAFYTMNGRLTIPGSSLKGAVRSLVEAITFSCVCKTGVKFDDNQKRQYGECRYRRRQDEICLACHLFGAMGHQGQVAFSDAPLVEGKIGIHYIPPQYEPKPDLERRYYPHKLQDLRDPLWPLQVAETNSCFQFRVRYTNLSTAALGMLLIALGQGQSSICLKLGAGKSSGLGAVCFEELQVVYLDIDQLYQVYDSHAANKSVDVTACIQYATASLVNQPALVRLQADLDCSHLEKVA